MSNQCQIKTHSRIICLLLFFLCVPGCLGSRHGEWTLVGRWVTTDNRISFFNDGTYVGNLDRREISGRYEFVNSSRTIAVISPDRNLPYEIELELLSRNTLRLQLRTRVDNDDESPYEEESDEDQNLFPSSRMIIFSRSAE